jgi:hypothetical protein
VSASRTSSETSSMNAADSRTIRIRISFTRGEYASANVCRLRVPFPHAGPSGAHGRRDRYRAVRDAAYDPGTSNPGPR